MEYSKIFTTLTNSPSLSAMAVSDGVQVVFILGDVAMTTSEL